uniref:N-terminal EF-hand calcium binding protein 3 n=1 Tax=Oryzias latipes TaxID=8090 RepID=A0A3P9MDN3_ORYLA
MLLYHAASHNVNGRQEWRQIKHICSMKPPCPSCKMRCDIVRKKQPLNASARHTSIIAANDGKLSFEEFNAYFADGILTTEELQELFYSIDGRQNNNLDTDKLSDYFSQHLGEYLNVLSSLESLNIAILKAMDKTKEEYQGASVLGQFVTRFMLRETSSQLLSLQRSLQCAMEAVEEQSSPTPCRKRLGYAVVELKVPINRSPLGCISNFKYKIKGGS